MLKLTELFDGCSHLLIFSYLLSRCLLVLYTLGSYQTDQITTESLTLSTELSFVAKSSGEFSASVLNFLIHLSGLIYS